MKRRIPHWLLVLPLTLTATGQLHADAQSDTAQQLKTIQSQLQKEQQSLDRDQQQRSKTLAQLQNIEQDISRVSAELRKLNGQLDTANTQLQDLEQAFQTRSTELAEDQSRLKQQVVSQYKRGQHEALKLLLSQREPARVGRNLVYYRYLNSARQQQIAETRTTLQDLAETRTAINEKKTHLESLRNQHQDTRGALRAKHQERNRLLAKLDSAIDSSEKRIARLEADQQRLADTLARLRVTASTSGFRSNKPFPGQKGRLPWPAQGPVTHSFGSSRKLGRLKWRGVVIEAGNGARVQAVANGRVVFADWLRGFGLLMILDHGQGYLSLYGHNEGLLVGVGEEVKQGDTIATAGAIDSQQAGGLYFELRYKGRPVDPVGWLEARR